MERKTLLTLSPKSGLTPGIETALDRVVRHMSERLNQSISLTTLCQISGLGYGDLQFHFKKRFRLSPMQWFRLRQLEFLAAARASGEQPYRPHTGGAPRQAVVEVSVRKRRRIPSPESAKADEYRS